MSGAGPIDLEAVARRAWEARTPSARVLRAALVPAAVAYGAATRLRNHLYDAGWLPARRVAAAVVSVGNISTGGTGKTPTALWLAERLMERGQRVGIVARGYGKQRRGVVVVGEGGRSLVSAAEGGDEAVLLARRFPGPVVTGERRAAAAAFACARFNLDTVVLDDGFQHRALARDADLVLLDETTGAWLLPAGPLRESPASLARARALLAVDVPVPPVVGRRVFRARLRPSALIRLSGASWVEEPLLNIRGREVVAVAGVARPERFLATLAAAGATVREVVRFPDHHAYQAGDAAHLAAIAGDALLVTTEKDLVKLECFPGLAALRALRVTLEVEDGDALVELLAGRPAAQVDLRVD